MKVYSTDAIRNLAVIGHGDAGKTQLISSLLYVAGETPRWGKVDEGTTVTDHEEDSIARKITLNIGLAHLDHRETKLNFIDTPGYAAFVSHARPALRVADCAVAVVDGVKGVEVQTEKTWAYANEFIVPSDHGYHQARQGAFRLWQSTRERPANIQPSNHSLYVADWKRERFSRCSGCCSYEGLRAGRRWPGERD